jgi:two-component system, LytTR family, sensor kinase
MTNRWLRFAIVGGIWALLGLVLTLEVFFNMRTEAKWVDFGDIALSQFGRAAMWACLAPFILRLQAAIPLSAGRWVGGVGFHLVFGFVVMATYFVGRLAAYAIFFNMPWQGFRRTVLDSFYGHNLVDMAFYWAVLAYGYGSEIQRKYKSEELRSAELEARLVATELKTLREQLRPHFLFNTLNTVSVLVREKKNDDAVTLLARLGSLLRMSLDRTNDQESTLREEMEFLDRYIDIQRARFSDRLSVNVSVDPAAMEARIPHLLLQPIVENAILHGIVPKRTPGQVDVLGSVADGLLHLEVRDDGPGLPETPNPREGVGLSNTRERLSKTYGDDGRMTLASVPGRGLAVRIVLPFRR